MRATCHCGAVVLNVTTHDGLGSAGRCDCSFCARRAAPAVQAPKDAVQIVQGAENLTLYQWGTKTAQHYFCKTCGIYMFHNQRADPTKVGINMGTLDGVNPSEHEPIPWHDGINHPSDRSE